MIISRTPFRASLFGGGTDLSDYYENSRFGYGAVISTAINMYTYMTVNKKFDNRIRVGYSKTEIVDCVDEIEHNIIREALKIVGIDSGIDIVYMADIPLDSAGIGLASSSALAVGILNALYAYTGKHVSAERLAKEACQIEIEILKNPIGKQDQYAVAYGGLQKYQFNADGSVFVDPIICKQETKKHLQDNLMLFYTGLTRKSSTVLTEQKEKIPQKMKRLDRLVEMVNIAESALQNNNLDDIGRLLHEAWMIKRQFASNVSNDLIDEMYNRAISAGALGGKILGAGGGGFLMMYVPDDKKEKVRRALGDYKCCDIGFEPQGSKIIYVSE
ncbi:MAG: GHMP kinase [Lachnospiraceae bacterium]|nr:GHMP kinase [Lachnospiraceae bacterium]